MGNETNPVYVVLGATGSIGWKVCERLSAKEAKLVVAARDEEKLDNLAAETNATSISLDATSQKAVDRVFEAAKSEFGRIDGAVNCVGSFLLKPAHKTCDREFAEVMALNVNTAFNTIRSAVRYMDEGGSVVLMSSDAGRAGLANHEAIAAAKAAVIGLTLSSASTYMPRGLRFNAVAPGLVDPEDVAAAIEWLLEQPRISGQVLGIDSPLNPTSQHDARG
ncbi:MAG: SDR family NAD(P)-dependent oxidoreductase [Rubrobacteraceae bacterium]